MWLDPDQVLGWLLYDRVVVVGTHTVVVVIATVLSCWVVLTMTIALVTDRQSVPCIFLLSRAMSRFMF